MNKRGFGVLAVVVIAAVALIAGGLIGNNLGSTGNFALFSPKSSSSGGSANLGGGTGPCNTCDTCLGDFS